ncbi:MAG: putative metal-dependent hydrolase [Pyrinomonadaceae bacterium]|nr:putative metal-dependent hydrolase [Pyrinomonadaceae bacterium]
MTNDLRYPIGEFDRDYEVSTAARAARIQIIKDLQSAVAAAVAGLNEDQLNTEYRPDGWTVRQTVHHIADSHSNSLTRFKLALTEDEPPTIRPYYEDRWAELADSKLPIDISLRMIDSLHIRWVALLDSMTDADYQKTFIHPETGEWPLEGALALYAWHSLHHTAHITHLREREGW